jgi:steroid 5-alpha reductase family enzyme
LVQQRGRNPGLADLLWAACISASALYYGLVAGGAMLPRLLVAMMGGIGGFRLFMHLLQRMLVEPADARYRLLRERAAGKPLRMLAFFVAKALSAALFSIPLYVAASNPEDRASAWTMLAAAVYIVGLSGEAYADIQLAQFRDQPRHRARTCRVGLWRYSRHPNYFFAFVHWCSYALLAVGVPWGEWSLTLLGPVLAALVAFRRIPAVEAEALRTRGEDYRAYQRTTRIFAPWRPDASDEGSPSWYVPPSSPAPVAASVRATPLPGARITPAPASRLPPAGPTTPQPERPRAGRENAAAPEKPRRIAAGEIGD